MDVKALKQKILDLAIHGKLLPLEKVEKIRKEEPASVLLEKIRAEKDEKIAKGELKRNKKDSFIFLGDDKRHYEKFADGSVKDIEDEIPFDVPEGWSWCRLGEICFNIKRGKSPKYTDKSTVMAFAQKCNRKEGPTSLDKALYIDESTLKKYPETEKLQLNDTIINSTGTGTLGRVGLFNCKIPQGVNAVYPDSHVTTIRTLLKVNKIYTYYFIKNSQTYLESMGEGSTNQKELKPDTIINMLFALPPLAEQQLIVEEIEKTFVQIDLLEQNKTDLQAAIKQAKSKILDLAIRGKLVPQDPNDEPASALLEKIRAEKEAKIAKGELKRDKNDSYIYKGSDNCHYEKINGNDVCIEEELPFAIPENWQWCRLKNIGYSISSKSYQILEKQIKKTGKLPVISQSTNFIEGYTDEIQFIFEDYPVILFGDHTKNVKYIDFPFVVGADGVKIIKQEKYINSKFFYYLILNASTKIEDRGYSRHFQFIDKYYYALPPLADQQRIVSKIEELFYLLDQIQTNLI